MVVYGFANYFISVFADMNICISGFYLIIDILLYVNIV